ncbi:MAG: hypothetical protein EHM93_14590 [Bacteroidales bacterium]|nr:MAG: hypothetical protein EHM93_14590 [Bacteroidales bacterium]
MISRIPFQIVELEHQSYHIVVDGMIDELAVTLIIDTGASRTIIDKSFADSLEKLPLGTENPIATGFSAEQIPVELYCIPKLTLEGVLFENIQSLTANLDAINEVYLNLTGKKIGGLIGCDFLLEHVKGIDFKRKFLTISKK